MDILPKTKKAMTREEVLCLVSLIEDQPILMTRETNASTNKLKEDAWGCVTNAYNAICGTVPKTKAQLKLKWDNLKKAARKRSQEIRLNALKTGGGKPKYIPPDEILEKVAGFLGSTCAGFVVPFGGDAEESAGEAAHAADEVLLDIELQSCSQLDGTKESAEDSPPQLPSQQRPLVETVQTGESSTTRFSIPRRAQEKSKKKRLDDARLQRELNVAKYFRLKAELLELEIEARKLNK